MQNKEHSLFWYIVLTYSQQSGIHSGGHRKFSMTFNFDASVLSSLFDIYTEALDKNRSRSVANSGHRNIKWDTSSASTEHKGQRSFRFWEPLEVDKTFMSILSLVNKSRILGFLITFIYTGKHMYMQKTSEKRHRCCRNLKGRISL